MNTKQLLRNYGRWNRQPVLAIQSHFTPKTIFRYLGTGKTLLQQTYDRFNQIMPDENILIVTNKEYLELVKQQLPRIPVNNILLEPYRRNTAPCIAFANYKILKKILMLA